MATKNLLSSKMLVQSQFTLQSLALTASKAKEVAMHLNQAVRQKKTLTAIDADWVDLGPEFPEIELPALTETETASIKAWMADITDAMSEEDQLRDPNNIQPEDRNYQDDISESGSVSSEVDTSHFMSYTHEDGQRAEFQMFDAVYDLGRLEVRKVRG